MAEQNIQAQKQTYHKQINNQNHSISNGMHFILSDYRLKNLLRPVQIDLYKAKSIVNFYEKKKKFFNNILIGETAK